MIYVSTSCVKADRCIDAVKQLHSAGFTNLELSGGTNFYPTFWQDVLNYQLEYKLNLQCHNYFPPPEQHFVLNMASLDNQSGEKSFLQVTQALYYSVLFNGKRYAFHAGFFIPVSMSEIGKTISSKELYDKEEAESRFWERLGAIKLLAEELQITIYVENNVFSHSNRQNYPNDLPFMLLSSKDYKAYQEITDFNLLLDVAHLKVSCQTLGLDYEKELHELIECTDYLHISDNDGLHDQNLGLEKDSKLISMLKEHSLKDKIMTLEVYNGIDAIERSYDLLQSII